MSKAHPRGSSAAQPFSPWVSPTHLPCPAWATGVAPDSSDTAGAARSAVLKLNVSSGEQLPAPQPSHLPRNASQGVQPCCRVTPLLPGLYTTCQGTRGTGGTFVQFCVCVGTRSSSERCRKDTETVSSFFKVGKEAAEARLGHCRGRSRRCGAARSAPFGCSSEGLSGGHRAHRPAPTGAPRGTAGAGTAARRAAEAPGTWSSGAAPGRAEAGGPRAARIGSDRPGPGAEPPLGACGRG